MNDLQTFSFFEPDNDFPDVELIGNGDLHKVSHLRNMRFSKFLNVICAEGVLMSGNTL
jgi:hypothetical protein